MTVFFKNAKTIMEFRMRKVFLQLLAIVFFAAGTAAASPIPVVPVQDTVTMVDLGAKSCIPCKMMMPVMEQVEKEYAGKAAIIFIDVWEIGRAHV